MRLGAVTLGELAARGIHLEVGCSACRLHLYLEASVLILPQATAVPAIGDLLRCPQCGVSNREQGYPIWARPDARPPKMGA